MNDSERQQLDRLLDGDLPLGERDAVQQRLVADAEAATYFAKRALLVSDLRRSLKRRRLQHDTMAMILESNPHLPDSSPTRLSRWGLAPMACVAAALLLLLTLAGFLLHTRSTLRSTVMAEIVESHDAAPLQDWQAGRRVAIGPIVLTSGRVGLRLPSGVLLDLVGPLRAELTAANQLRLWQGQATADVGETGKGFSIETVNVRVVDLGTRFGVAVGPSNETDVVVFEGKVEVFDPGKQRAAQQIPLTLGEGEAIRVDDSRKPQRARMVTLSPDARSLRGGAVSDIVADVKDNIVQGDFHRYYGLLRGGMGEGARLYTTGHTRTWHALPGASFPQELLGGDVVCTSSANKREADLQITLMINRPCEVYVLPDAAAPVPQWLQRDFIDTGLRLRSGPWTPRGIMSDPQADDTDGKTYVEHAVWKRLISQPGPVVLGSPRPGKQSGSQAMYGIVVKSLEAPQGSGK
jgi:hypothetical protein